MLYHPLLFAEFAVCSTDESTILVAVTHVATRDVLTVLDDPEVGPLPTVC
jgi:hypothetical protein